MSNEKTGFLPPILYFNFLFCTSEVGIKKDDSGLLGIVDVLSVNDLSVIGLRGVSGMRTVSFKLFVSMLLFGVSSTLVAVYLIRLLKILLFGVFIRLK